MNKTLPEVVFDSIDDVKKYQWYGNAHHDMPAFMAIDRAIFGAPANGWSIADQAEALRIMSDKGMGCGREDQTDDTQLVSNYMVNC